MYGIAFAIMGEQDQGRRGLAGVYPRIEGAMVYGITNDSRGGKWSNYVYVAPSVTTIRYDCLFKK
jgi:hypothetical protein